LYLVAAANRTFELIDFIKHSSASGYLLLLLDPYIGIDQFFLISLKYNGAKILIPVNFNAENLSCWLSWMLAKLN